MFRNIRSDFSKQDKSEILRMLSAKTKAKCICVYRSSVDPMIFPMIDAAITYFQREKKYLFLPLILTECLISVGSPPEIDI